jgi:hypothetical protein
VKEVTGLTIKVKLNMASTVVEINLEETSFTHQVILTKG